MEFDAFQGLFTEDSKSTITNHELLTLFEIRLGGGPDFYAAHNLASLGADNLARLRENIVQGDPAEFQFWNLSKYVQGIRINTNMVFKAFDTMKMKVRNVRELYDTLVSIREYQRPFNKIFPTFDANEFKANGFLVEQTNGIILLTLRGNEDAVKDWLLSHYGIPQVQTNRDALQGLLFNFELPIVQNVETLLASLERLQAQFQESLVLQLSEMEVKEESGDQTAGR